MQKIRFSLRHFTLFLSVLIIEVCIALFLNDHFIRPFVGDLLVVVLIYFFFKSWLDATAVKLAIAVFLFACLVETLQYFNLIEWLGLEHLSLAKIILGATFDWLDLLAYFLGTIFSLLLDQLITPKLSLNDKLSL